MKVRLFQKIIFQVTFEELKDFAKGFIKAQMAQFGQLDPAEDDLDNIASRVLSNQDEVRQFVRTIDESEVGFFYKENANLKAKEVTYEDFG